SPSSPPSSPSPPHEMVGLETFGVAEFFGAGVLTLVGFLVSAGDVVGSGAGTLGKIVLSAAGFNSA
ncbi:MAG: hypothetical protein QNL78_04560, partial [Actinomycetes bacterium]